jgi:chromosome segregation ATPase
MGRPKKIHKSVELKNDVVLENVKSITLDGVSKKIAAVQVDVQQTLAKLSTELTQNLDTLNTVNAAISLKQEELKNLHDIEATKISLDTLNQDIEATRQTWTEEQTRKAKEDDLARRERQLRWTREEEQYKYERDQAHKKLEDDFNARIQEATKQNTLQAEALQRSWEKREADLKSKEQEFTTLRAEVEAFPAKLKSETEKTAAIVGNTMKKDFEMEKKLLEATFNNKIQLAEAQVTSEKMKTVELEKQVASLKAQLDMAQKDIKEISTKALESASGRETINSLQKALENQPRNMK